MDNLSVKLVWNKSPDTAVKNAGINNSTLLFMAQELKRLYNPYVPKDGGPLSSEVNTYVKNNVGVIHYTQPYAHYQYTGKVYIDPAINAAGFLTSNGWLSRKGTKVPTNRDLIHQRTYHPLATSLWDKVAYPQIIDKYTRATQNFIRGRMP